MALLEKQLQSLLDDILMQSLGNMGGIMAGTFSQKVAFPGGAPALMLPRSSPEKQGIKSKDLQAFFEEAANIDGANLHTLMVLKGGNVLAQGSFAPYSADIWHVSHSLCKTVVGAAVGFAISEGLFALEDSVVAFFGDKTNILQKQIYKNITVRHLLTMSSGVFFNEISEAFSSTWLQSYFSSIIGFRPGSSFSYNSMNSFVLAAMVCKTSGQGLMEYLQPRLFAPLGFGPITWEKSPEGIEKGGWGMYIMPEDIAKLGLLYLNGGKINLNGETKQVLPEGWAQQSVKAQIISADGKDEYGYQLWANSQNNSFCLNGIFGQYAFGLPGQDILVVATAGAQNFFRQSALYSLFQKYFAGKSFPKKRFFAPISRIKLNKLLAGLRFGKTLHKGFIKIESKAQLAPFLGKTWVFPENYACLLPLIFQGMNNNFAKGIRSLRLTQSGQLIEMAFLQQGLVQLLPIGINGPAQGRATLGAETYCIGSTAFLKQEEAELHLLLELCFLECSSARYIQLSLKGEGVQLHFYEAPDILQAVENAGKTISNVTLMGMGGISSPIVNFIGKNDILRLKKEDFFNPTIYGKQI